jgi:DNA-binding CsgD family transcriptional regulator
MSFTAMKLLSSLWRRLLHDLGLQRLSTLSCELNEELVRSLQDLAEREKRSKEAVAIELLSLGLSQRRKAEEALQLWKSLSPREQQAVALACSDYPIEEIANRMGISPETVKTHLLRAVHKFGVRGKAELRQILVDWDFGDWES